MAINGLASFDRTYLGIRCSGFGIWAYGDTRALAFANWQRAVKESKQKQKGNTPDQEEQ